MGRRDYRHRETKKPKKGAKKPSVAEMLSTPSNVEVVKKERKEKAIEEKTSEEE
ncbi:MAG: hypothetical protein SVO26_06075 [Chloroflexota bacterium]|nr:hypothetical protein [Chloroflexota bacterium]